MTHILAKLYVQDLIDADLKYIYARADTNGVDDDLTKQAMGESIAERLASDALQFVRFETLDTGDQPVVE